MLKNETIEFACPSCHTGLNVPTQLAGVTGPCPHCQASIIAPSSVPAAQPAVPTPPPQQHPLPPSQAPAPPIANHQAPPQPTLESPPAHLQSSTIPSEQPASAAPPKQPVTSFSQRQPRSAPAEMIPARRPTARKRKIWPTRLFPALFLLLTAAVVYLILDLMGILNFGEKTPKIKDHIPKTEIIAPALESEPPSATPATPTETTSPKPTPLTQESIHPLDYDPQDLNKPGEVSAELPDLTATVVEDQSTKAQGIDDSIRRRTAAIKEASDVLKRFLNARTLEERVFLITKSKRNDAELAASCLAKPFLKSYQPTILDSRENEADHSFEVFFSVPFAQSKSDRHRIILVKTIASSEEEAPKIHTDPFIDLYEGSIQKFYQNMQPGTKEVHGIIAFSAYCFDDIPKSNTMAKVTFFTNTSVTENSVASAYLSQESKAFKQLSEMAKNQKRIPVTLSVAWDMETDPTKPFLQVVRVEDIHWSL